MNYGEKLEFDDKRSNSQMDVVVAFCENGVLTFKKGNK
jgi:hypothetical protein